MTEKNSRAPQVDYGKWQRRSDEGGRGVPEWLQELSANPGRAKWSTDAIAPGGRGFSNLQLLPQGSSVIRQQELDILEATWNVERSEE